MNPKYFKPEEIRRKSASRSLFHVLSWELFSESVKAILSSQKLQKNCSI